MSVPVDVWLQILQTYLKGLDFADRVQMIQKLLKIVVEVLDGMEAEVKKECG